MMDKMIDKMVNNPKTAKNNKIPVGKKRINANNAKINNTKKELQSLVNFVFELGELKRVKRTGWWLIGIKDPETVAEHSFRAAAVGYILAKMENANADKVMRMCLFNDLHETRLNDLHKVGHRYIDFKKAERAAFKEQIDSLPAFIKKTLFGIIDDLQNDKTKEGIVARDADLLECAIQAKEYIDLGFDAKNWINNVRKSLKTRSAKAMLKEIEKTYSMDWWHDLKKIER
jgi:putative hydrolase of HD superfamily